MKQLPTLLAENRTQGLAVELSRAEHTPGYLDSLPAGVLPRAVVAGKAMRVASKTPPSLMRLPMKVLTPPQKDGR